MEIPRRRSYYEIPLNEEAMLRDRGIRDLGKVTEQMKNRTGFKPGETCSGICKISFQTSVICEIQGS